MTLLKTQVQGMNYDLWYESLIASHQDLNAEQSQAFNARLILILANHIGDLQVLQEALQAARIEQKA
jgi:hypothetical protein